MTKGFTLVEVIVAATIITVFLGALIGTRNLYIRASHSSPDKIKALYLAEERIENFVYLRNSSWHENIEPLPSQFSETIDNFVREVNVIDADGHTKAIKVSVSWPDHDATSTVSVSALLTNLYDN